VLFIVFLNGSTPIPPLGFLPFVSLVLHFHAALLAARLLLLFVLLLCLFFHNRDFFAW
jgi:hypothetical protein